MNKLTCTEIIDKVVEHFRTHPRSVDNGSCRYRFEDDDGQTRNCAVGMWMDWDEVDKVTNQVRIEGANVRAVAYDLEDKDLSLDTLLRPEVHGQPVKFWLDVQELHDRAWYWSMEPNELGGHDLTLKGLLQLEELRTTWGES